MKKYIITLLFLSTILFVYGLDQITIYNDNFSLVRTQIELDFKKGLADYYYDNIPGSIDAASVILKPLKGNFDLFSQNYEYDLATSDKIYAKYLGKVINATTKNGTKYEGKLQFHDPVTLGIIESSTNKLILINPNEVESVNLAALPGNFFLKPTLHWLINSPAQNKLPVEFSYLTGGMAWNVTYNAIWNDKELELHSWVTINNYSGKGFENVKLKLVAGDVNKVRDYMDVAVNEMVPSGMANMKRTMAAPTFKEQEFQDFHLYTLSDPVNLNDNQIQQLRLYPVKTVKAKAKYEYRTFSQKVSSILSFKNSENQGLGLPLPKGVIKIYKQDGDDQNLEFIGENSIDHTTLNKDVNISYGNSFDLIAETTVLSTSAVSGKTTDRKIQVVINNNSKVKKTITIKHNVPGREWEIMNLNAPSDFKKDDSNNISFEFDINPSQEIKIDWKERYQY